MSDPNIPTSGRVDFDYSTNNGVATIGEANWRFETKWSRAGGTSIHLYRDGVSIEAIAIAKKANKFSDVRDAARFDFSSRVCQIKVGEIAVLRNSAGLYAALHVFKIKAEGHGSTIDEVSFRYCILPDGSRDFSKAKLLDFGAKNFSKHVLFLGSGFSQNWGGLLADQIWEHIFNSRSVQAKARLKDLLISDRSFESVLDTVRTGLYEEDDLEAVQEAIKSAFAVMDQNFCNPNPPVLNATVNDFISNFCRGPIGQETGYVFTLNQDLLLERIYGMRVDRQKLTIPGIRWNEPCRVFPAGSAPIPLATISDSVSSLSTELQGHFNLIKLHGSINWRERDNADVLIMGQRKAPSISKLPLINWYFHVFERALTVEGTALMVIGYGWGDEHINAVLAEAIRENKLKLHVWDIRNPLDALNNAPYGDEIAKGIMGITTKPMSDVIPPTPMSPQTGDYLDIVKTFFRH